MSLDTEINQICKKYDDLEKDWKDLVKKNEELSYKIKFMKEVYEDNIRKLEDKRLQAENENNYFRGENQILNSKLRCFNDKEKLIRDLMENSKCDIVEVGLEKSMFDYVINRLIDYLSDIDYIELESYDI